MTTVGRPIDLDALADLEEQRRFLLGSLRDLERERDAGDIDDGDYQTLRDDYTARTAAVLRAIEDGRATLTAPREPRRTRARRIRITALATVGVLGLAIVAGLLVARSSGERVQGGTPAGNATSPTAARLREAHDLDQKGRALDAIKAYDAVLRLDPKNVDALTAEGWLIGRTGLQAGSVELVDKGLASIDKALAVDASYPSAARTTPRPPSPSCRRSSPATRRPTTGLRSRTSWPRP